jgi:hypothetical protein
VIVDLSRFVMYDPVSPSPPAFVDTLHQAVRALRGDINPTTGAAWAKPTPVALVEALLLAEQAAKQQRLKLPLQGLWGQWRLCFSAPKQAKLASLAAGQPITGRYFPSFLPAHISFGPASTHPDPSITDLPIIDPPITDPPIAEVRAAIGNQVRLGGLGLKFTGPARYVAKKNLLVFDFLALGLLLGDRTLGPWPVRGGETAAAAFYDRAIARQPFFAFVWMDADCIAARGRGGGLALWIREHAVDPGQNSGKTVKSITDSSPIHT